MPVLGSTDGNAFDARVDDAVQTIYDSGDRNAVAFSHGATMADADAAGDGTQQPA